MQAGYKAQHGQCLLHIGTRKVLGIYIQPHAMNVYTCRRDREDREREIREAEEREALKNMTEAERRAWEAAHPKVRYLTAELQCFTPYSNAPSVSAGLMTCLPALCFARPAPMGFRAS